MSLIMDESECSIEVDETKSNFLLENKKLMLTYKGWIDKKFLRGTMERLASGQLLRGVPKEVKFFCAAHETGDKNHSYDHTHVIVEFSPAIRTKTCKFFDVNIEGQVVPVHPNIRKIITMIHWKRALKYMSKEDPENASLAAVDTCDLPLEDVKNAKSTLEAMELGAKRWSDITGIKAYREEASRTRKLTRYKPFVPREWQKEVLELDTIEPDDRKIIWYIDIKGGAGKSRLCRSMMYELGNRWYSVTEMGTAKDAATIVNGALKNGWEQWGLFMDLPRAAQNHTSIYVNLENIKNGLITTQKYEGGTQFFDSPHIVVFSNWPPVVDLLTPDRWDIRVIRKNHTARKISVAECREMRGECAMTLDEFLAGQINVDSDSDDEAE